MAHARLLIATEPALAPGRNLAPASCDVFGLLSRACDLAADEVVARGVALSLKFDPALRAPRSVRAEEVSGAARSMIAAMLRLADRGALAVEGALRGDHAALTVSGPFHKGQRPDPSFFRRAAEHSRLLDGRLDIDQRDGRLILALTFPAPSARPSVLLVEQDWPRRNETIARLGDAGFEVRIAENGRMALKQVQTSRPTAAMIDLFLESDDALLLSRTLATAGGMPVLALTRQGRSVSGWALRQAGFAGVLENPIDPAALRALLADPVADQSKRPNS